MKTKKQIKQFVLDTLLPYKENPELCSIDAGGNCRYYYDNGIDPVKMCAFGKHLRHPEDYKDSTKSAGSLIQNVGGKELLTKEAYDMQLNVHQWDAIQSYHDDIAKPHLFAHDVLNHLEDLLDIELPELR